jgi:hypothetical protein
VRNFFVCALPRSRTAWTANLLTHGDCFCFHEPAVGLNSLSELRAVFEATGRPIVGSADCGNAWLADGLREEFPECRFVVVRRDLNQCRKELIKMGLPDNGTLEKAAEMLDYVASKYSPLIMDAKQMGDPEAVKMLCNYVGAPFDISRFEMLTALNVQARPELIGERMTAANLASVFKLMEAS